MNTQLLILAGSLAAVGILILAAWALKLGGRTRIADEAEVRTLAEEALGGFDAREIALDAEGRAALAADAAGRILLLVPHGVHYAARLLEPGSIASRDRGNLTIRTGDRTFPTATLDLGAAAGAWDMRINALNG